MAVSGNIVEADARRLYLAGMNYLHDNITDILRVLILTNNRA